MLLIIMLLISFDMVRTTFLAYIDILFETVNGELEPFHTNTSWTTIVTRNPFTTGEYEYMQYQYNDAQDYKKHEPPVEDIAFEPVINTIRHNIQETGIDCDGFETYAFNCTKESAYIYNSSSKSPPMPAKIGRWCKAIRLLTNCAVDWNSECKDVTESHFNEESIKGHMHVVNNICDNDWFLTSYDSLPQCIDRVATVWENCYVAFKSVVDYEKNRTQEWTHFMTHFFLCCARSKFRRCTLDALFIHAVSKCSFDEAVVLQKFSVIVSEGDVFQDCDKNMMYTNCPGGDPKPPSDLLYKLMNAKSEVDPTEDEPRTLRDSVAVRTLSFMLAIVICLLKLCL